MTTYADDTDYDATEAREAAAGRERMIASLHELADLLETHPDLPAPYDLYVSSYVSAEEARACCWGIPHWEKRNSPTASYVSYTRTFGAGGSRYGRGSIVYSLEVGKEATCERIQTGVRHVEATEARDEPVYEWNCTSGPGNDSETE